MGKKLGKIKWYRIVEKSNCIDNYAEYVYAVNRPSGSFRPVNEKYYRQRSRFKSNKEE